MPRPVQGVIKSYDPGSGDGVVVRDTDLSEHELAPGAVAASIFRMLRQGQRIVFDLDAEGKATSLGLGSEVDMGTPGFPLTTEVPGTAAPAAAAPAVDATATPQPKETPQP